MKHSDKGDLRAQIAALLLAAGTILCLTACSGDSGSKVIENIEPSVTDSTAPVTLATETTVITTTTIPVVPPDISVNMLAVGDNLVQTAVYKAAQARAVNGRNIILHRFTKTSSRLWRLPMSR